VVESANATTGAPTRRRAREMTEGENDIGAYRNTSGLLSRTRSHAKRFVHTHTHTHTLGYWLLAVRHLRHIRRQQRVGDLLVLASQGGPRVLLLEDTVADRAKEAGGGLQGNEIVARDRLGHGFLEGRGHDFHPSHEHPRDGGRCRGDPEREHAID